MDIMAYEDQEMAIQCIVFREDMVKKHGPKNYYTSLKKNLH